MRAVSGPVPTDDTGWAYEVKWDGMRILATVAPDEVRLASGNAIDVTTRFPELHDLADHLAGHRAVLDGEVVAFDDAGRSDFQRLQARMHVSDPARVARLLAQVPLSYVVFDLLEVDGARTVDLPYLDRRRLLAGLVEPAGCWSVPAHQIGDGAALFAAAARQGLEGIMAKRMDSPYLPGRRSASWRKCKVRRQQEVVVGGWSAGEGGRSGTFGSLLVGVHDPTAPGRPLRYAGGVGTGFDDAALTELRGRLADLATDDCPFSPAPPAPIRRTARWVRPELVAEVAFAEWSAEARLRHPSYLGLRLDKDPADVVREPIGGEPPGGASGGDGADGAVP
jgi:bifunctional non-homologous end joining protein LigD